MTPRPSREEGVASKRAQSLADSLQDVSQLLGRYGAAECDPAKVVDARRALLAYIAGLESCAAHPIDRDECLDAEGTTVDDALAVADRIQHWLDTEEPDLTIELAIEARTAIVALVARLESSRAASVPAEAVRGLAERWKKRRDHHDELCARGYHAWTEGYADGNRDCISDLLALLHATGGRDDR